MRTHEKLRVMRALKGWSQEIMAEKLGYSANGYAKIERGETQIKTEKLEEMAKSIGVDFQQLLDLNEKNVFNIIDHFSSQHGNIYLTETQCAHELEKAHLIIEQKDKEINYLKRENKHFEEENTRLKEMIELMKITTSL